LTRIAITGGTGFVGRHVARALVGSGHQVVLLARGVDERDTAIRELGGARFVRTGVDDVERLAAAFEGCDGVAHCAGINRERGAQTYERVHVRGTRNVVEAARRAGVKRLALLSFLRARPDCGSPYHESKWRAEEIVRASDLEWTVLEAAMIYGRGDHMLDHLSHALHTFPAFPAVGRDRPVRPVAIEDVVAILLAALVEGRLARRTVAVMGPEALPFGEVVRRVAAVTGRRTLVVRLPTPFHYLAARFFELVMDIPLVATAQVRMLSEGMAEPLASADALPPDLEPATRLSPDVIARGLPPAGSFSLRDLRRPPRAR
jgi:uncharacterized protein YbjT (DUF2867 family)